MKLLVFRALWGMTGPVPVQIERIAAAGYDGIEFWPAHVEASRGEILSLSEQYKLRVIVGTLVTEQQALEEELTRLADYQPLKINLHGGRDSVSRDEGCAFFEEALRVEEQLGIPLVHETHRRRIFYTPWDTAFFFTDSIN